MMHFEMDNEKLKLIVKNLESLVNILKEEVYSETESIKYEEVRNSPPPYDYDEIFND